MLNDDLPGGLGRDKRNLLATQDLFRGVVVLRDETQMTTLSTPLVLQVNPPTRRSHPARAGYVTRFVLSNTLRQFGVSRYRHRSHLAVALAAVTMLAGCGGSSSDQAAAAVKRCQQRGASHGACQCAVTYASAHGDPPAKLIREMTDGSAARDPVAVQAGALCVGAK